MTTQRPPGRSRSRAASRPVSQLVQLLVDGDPDGLEYPAGRMPPGASGGGGDGLPDHVGELTGGGDRAGGDDGPGDAPGEPALAVVGEQFDEGVLVGLVHHVGRGSPDGRVHPHVEGGVPPVGEAALGHVELG